jgi:hypothetical protein
MFRQIATRLLNRVHCSPQLGLWQGGLVRLYASDTPAIPDTGKLFVTREDAVVKRRSRKTRILDVQPPVVPATQDTESAEATVQSETPLSTRTPENLIHEIRQQFQRHYLRKSTEFLDCVAVLAHLRPPLCSRCG